MKAGGYFLGLRSRPADKNLHDSPGLMTNRTLSSAETTAPIATWAIRRSQPSAIPQPPAWFSGQNAADLALGYQVEV